MKAVVQRVTSAAVTVDANIIGEIKNGFLVLLGIAPGDTQADAQKLADKIARLRVFADENGKMNRSVLDVGGDILVVSNFTLYADCRHGCRPSFTHSARPNDAQPLYEYFMQMLKQAGVKNVSAGQFGADMQVALVNDGPVTLVLDTAELMGKRSG